MTRRRFLPGAEAPRPAPGFPTEAARHDAAIQPEQTAPALPVAMMMEQQP
ncbi:hypothetical protein [Sphingopyxis indica]|uniref:Uncharacterized protein n=1 Tax=Sphingopyxis indica TaxID=436663 RepID=A0A239LI22_9SPHN|nr:hypothetical protein [Sphingopyxis indica]SNT29572.1 hypothetical protein SAMN06295955_1245 [Sphingopyxis indica]